jgi:hypothetical protein
VEKHFSEAEFRELQAEICRKKSAILADKPLKDLTN